MNITVLLADVGRPSQGSALNLLNAGWSMTMAVPISDHPGEWGLPGQALAVFFQAQGEEIGRTHHLSMQLTDETGEVVLLGPEREPSVEGDFVIFPPPTAAKDMPVVHSMMVEFPAGALRLRKAPGHYTWSARVGDEIGEAHFWVNAVMTGQEVRGVG